MAEQRFEFQAPVWRSENAAASWWFVSVPTEIADDIADLVPPRPGFGSVRVHARIGATRWATSLFPSTKESTYILPVKRAVRERERLGEGDTAQVELTLAD